MTLAAASSARVCARGVAAAAAGDGGLAKAKEDEVSYRKDAGTARQTQKPAILCCLDAKNASSESPLARSLLRESDDGLGNTREGNCHEIGVSEKHLESCAPADNPRAPSPVGAGKCGAVAGGSPEWRVQSRAFLAVLWLEFLCGVFHSCGLTVLSAYSPQASSPPAFPPIFDPGLDG